ncbi:dihydrolipoyl dehydrogenase family protein [Crocinitomix algicola]|uniref:dihydrolipoyl dehydrogenase family protein n=1 Tax=Crocinitomix algicola TaxID=1740263 RepID=UPI000872AAA3|nr:NAD(P)/FAD-dependent oxidoreductase [Crocinitomix algicola]
MSNTRYDLIVIGGGPAGYAAAMRAIDYGKKVCLIEKKRVGGAGVYHGALSSKTLWELSQRVKNVNETIISLGRKPYEISWAEVKKTLEEAIFERKFQYSCHIKLLKNMAGELFSYRRGYGKLVSKNCVSIQKENGDTTEIEADNILIATGSRPRTLPNITVDEKAILTSDGIDLIEDYPKSMVIVGAGVIGCEYATIFSNFGKTKVYIIDRADQILPFEDNDISKTVANNLEKRGVTVHHKAQLVRMEVVDGEVEYEIESDGEREVIRVEKALLSVGRVANFDNIGLEEVGVKLGPQGRYIGDNNTQTNIPNIYAAGDISGRIALVNVGEIEGRHAVERMFDKDINPLSYDNVCTIMFLEPEVAAVGMNEKQCIEQNIPCRVVKLDFSVMARAIAMRKTQGFFKIIVTNDDDMKILGMRAVGEHASSAIEAVALLIKMDRGIAELAELVHPHPSIVEGVQECVRMLMNRSVFKSSVFKDKLACYSLVDGVKTPLQRL